MGNKLSAIHGVKSDNFYLQGNAINEIWLGDVELVSRLPFGDSDLGQAGWPKGDWPKIPWHQFIIPLKRGVETVDNTTMIANSNATLGMSPADKNSKWFGGTIYAGGTQEVALFHGIVLGMINLVTVGLVLNQYVDKSERKLRAHERLHAHFSTPQYAGRKLKRDVGVRMCCCASYILAGSVFAIMCFSRPLYGVQMITTVEIIRLPTMCIFVCIGLYMIFYYARTFRHLRRVLARPGKENLPFLPGDQYEAFMMLLEICPSAIPLICDDFARFYVDSMRAAESV